MTRRGAVGLGDMFFVNEYPDTAGFIVTFADGTQIQNSGGLATICDKMIRKHGIVIDVEEVTIDGRFGMFQKCKHTRCSACRTKELCCELAFISYNMVMVT